MARHSPRYDLSKEYESNLAKIRVEENYTLKELSGLVGCTQSTLCELQNGMATPYYLQTHKIKPYVDTLCLVLKSNLSDLFPRYICDINRFQDIDVPLREIQLPGISFSETIYYRSNMTTSKMVVLIDLLKWISKALSILKPRERMVLCKRFGIGMDSEYTVEEVADQLMITRQRVWQIEAKAIRKTREFVHKNKKFMKYYHHYLEICL